MTFISEKEEFCMTFTSEKEEFCMTFISENEEAKRLEVTRVMACLKSFVGIWFYE